MHTCSKFAHVDTLIDCIWNLPDSIVASCHLSHTPGIYDSGVHLWLQCFPNEQEPDAEENASSTTAPISSTTSTTCCEGEYCQCLSWTR